LDYAYDVRALGGLHWMSLKYNIDKYVDPVKINNYHQLALAAYQDGDYLNASQNWRQVTKLDPENHMARTYLNKSEQVREKILAQLLYETELKIQEQDYEGAMHVLKEAAKLKSPNEDLLKRIVDLQAIYKKKLAKERADKIKSHAKAAKRFEKEGKLANALDEWEDLLALDPNHELAPKKIKDITVKISKRLDKYYKIGLKLFKQKKYPKAIKEFKRVLKIDKNHVLARFYLGKSTDIMDKMARNFYRKGQRYLDKRNYKKSLRYFNRVLEVVAQYRDVKLKIEYVKGLQKRLKPALKQFSIAKKYKKDKRLGDALAVLKPLIQGGNFNSTILAVHHQIKNKINESTKLYERGIEYHQNLKYDLAVSSLERSVAINNQSPAKRLLVEIYSYQGIQAFRKGDLVNAVKIWNKGMAIDSNHILIKKYIQRATNKMKFLKRIFKGAEHE